jgi:hypothetical protein
MGVLPAVRFSIEARLLSCLRSAAFVAINDSWNAFWPRSLQSGLRGDLGCDKNKVFSFAPKGQA